MNLRDILREECGLSAAINVIDAARHVRDMEIIQQPRGGCVRRSGTARRGTLDR